MNNIKVDCVLDAKANLGEGAIWSVKDQMLYWVDINEGLLCKYNPDNGKNIAIDFKKPIGCFALKNNLNVILALTDGFFEFDQITNIDECPLVLRIQEDQGKRDRNWSSHSNTKGDQRTKSSD